MSRPTADKTLFSGFSTGLDSALKRNHEVARRLSRLAKRLAKRLAIERLVVRLAKWWQLSGVSRAFVSPDGFIPASALLSFEEGGELWKSVEEQQRL
jgi:hypothetical protein